MATTRQHEIAGSARRDVAFAAGALVRTLLPLPGVIGLELLHTAHQALSRRQALRLALRRFYARPVQAALTLKETKACSDLAYKGKPGDWSRDRNWTIPEGGVYETWITGFRAVRLTHRFPHDRRVVLAFAGTDPTSPSDLVTDVHQALNTNPWLISTQYAQAAALAGHLQRIHGAFLRVTGHSLGGGLANFASVKLGIPGAGLNAAPLGPGTLLHLLLFSRNQAPSFTHYNNDGEFVSSYAPGQQLGQVCQVESTAGLFAGHFIENVNTNAPILCYDDYVRRGSRGANGSE
jgi:hypothetical protein